MPDTDDRIANKKAIEARLVASILGASAEEIIEAGEKARRLYTPQKEH